MEYIDIFHSKTEITAIGPEIDVFKRPKRIIIEYTIGNPKENISKTEDTEIDDKQDMSS